MRVNLTDRTNRFIDRYIGGEQRRASFDVAATIPALMELEKNFPAIRGELDGILLNTASIPRYHEIDGNQHYISAQTDPQSAWRTYVLYSVGQRNEAYAAKCPRTADLLGKIPHLINAMFSILEPGKSVPAHCGPYRGVLRYHLAVLVPTHNPPHIRVRDEIHQWKEGKGFLFDDSLEHEVVNHSSQMRVVLAVDVLRPLPLIPHCLNALTVRWISRSKPVKNMIKTIKAKSGQMNG